MSHKELYVILDSDGYFFETFQENSSCDHTFDVNLIAATSIKVIKQ